MTDRQIKALNTLYAATIEVMEAFAPENVGAVERREALSRMIENFLITASSPNEGIVYSEMPRNSVGIVGEGAENIRGSISERHEAVAQTDTIPVSPGKAKKKEDANFRYAVGPVYLNGDFVFKRVKQKEDKDSDTVYPYELYIEDTNGTFKIDAPLADYGEEEYKRTFPEMVVELVSGDTPRSEATCLKTVVEGEIEKEGKSWKVTKRAKVTYGK